MLHSISYLRAKERTPWNAGSLSFLYSNFPRIFSQEHMVADSDRGKTPKLHWAELSCSQILVHHSQQRGLPFPATAMNPMSQKDVCTCPWHSSISGCKKYLTENYTSRYLSAIVFSNVTPSETCPAASLTALSRVSLEDMKDRSHDF